ncbi:MAG: hypothetical protein V3S11_05750 [Elusimicrobiota bacterium]
MVNIIIITHGEFGAYLVEAAEAIVGRQEGVRSISISSRLPMGEARGRLERAVSELRGDGGLVVATDMPGGTPSNLAMPIIKDMENVRIVSGVNLYMLVTAFNSRGTMKLEALAEEMLSAGRRAIQDIKSMFLTKA